VTVEGQSLAPGQIPQLSSGVPMMLFSMKTDRNFVTLKREPSKQTRRAKATSNAFPSGGTMETRFLSPAATRCLVRFCWADPPISSAAPRLFRLTAAPER
jgi:hypothetical protein